MAQIQEYKEEINDQFIKLDKHLNKSPLFTSDQNKWKTQAVNIFKDLKKLILGLTEEVKELSPAQASHYVGSIKTFQKKLLSYEQDYQRKLRGETGDFKGMTEELKEKPNPIAETIQKGDNSQKRMLDALVSMDKTVEEGIQLAADINAELDKQIQQLDRMADKVKDTHSTLKRAQKTINYFVKAMECDKCMMVMLILIILALVTVVVLLIKNG